ncbi:MAG TPA: RNA polymerase sigma factor [Actinotalea sp.]|nr:RNA polymerase sigma factor [Actinotalea sp.]
MFNPFAEVINESEDLALIESARRGSRDGLERLILRHQAWVYNIAVRMVFHPQDAEEVTQEVLIKAVTRLSTFRGDSQFRTWLYRITANHVLNMKRRGAELRPQTFASYAAAINDTPDLDLPDPKRVPVDVPLVVEEAKLTCTTGMLMCLDRRQRLVFTLGEILGVSDSVGSEVMEMSADNFRQSLARARRDLYQFMHGQCGLVNASNPCRCPKKTKGFIAGGHVDPAHLLFVPLQVRRIKDAAADTVREIEDVLGLPPCLRVRRSNHVKTARQSGPGDRGIERHRCWNLEGTGRVRGGRGRELRGGSNRRGSGRRRD